VLEYRKVLAIEKVLLTSSVEGAQRGSFSIAQDPVLHHQSEWSNKDILQVWSGLAFLSLFKLFFF
jgi:hypothetical protein